METQTRRQKYWKELSNSEKIERVRCILKILQLSADKIDKDMRTLRKHSHHNDKMVIPLEREFGGIVEGGKPKSDEVYF